MSGLISVTGEVVALPEGARIQPYHMPWCFGCGPENDQGLGVSVRLEGDKIVADLRFAPRFQGGPGLVHGGAIAAFIDDLMGFVPVAHHVPAVTGSLKVDYRRPIPLGTTLRGEAWLSGRDGRKLFTEAVGKDADGVVYVEATALFLTVGVDHFVQALDDMPPEHRERLSTFRHDEYYP